MGLDLDVSDTVEYHGGQGRGDGRVWGNSAATLGQPAATGRHPSRYQLAVGSVGMIFWSRSRVHIQVFILCLSR